MLEVEILLIYQLISSFQRNPIYDNLAFLSYSEDIFNEMRVQYYDF